MYTALNTGHSLKCVLSKRLENRYFKVPRCSLIEAKTNFGKSGKKEKQEELLTTQSLHYWMWSLSIKVQELPCAVLTSIKYAMPQCT